MIRKIIEIDDELCNGCGNCIISCAEGALKLVDGKARLVSDVYCDGLGACLGDCPTGALKIVEREAPAFDEEEVERHLEAKGRLETLATLPCGCPGTAAVMLEGCGSVEGPAPAGSSLKHFPVKLQLIQPGAPFLQGSELLLMADCCALCYPGLHHGMLKNRAVAMGCPKLDNLDAHIERLTEIVRKGGIRGLTVVHMEVPCCSGFVHAAQAAVQRAGSDIPVRHIMIARGGEIVEQGPVGHQARQEMPMLR